MQNLILCGIANSINSNKIDTVELLDYNSPQVAKAIFFDSYNQNIHKKQQTFGKNCKWIFVNTNVVPKWGIKLSIDDENTIDDIRYNPSQIPGTFKLNATLFFKDKEIDDRYKYDFSIGPKSGENHLGDASLEEALDISMSYTNAISTNPLFVQLYQHFSGQKIHETYTNIIERLKLT